MGEAGGGHYYPDSDDELDVKPPGADADDLASRCNHCPFPASCAEFGRCVLEG